VVRDYLLKAQAEECLWLFRFNALFRCCVFILSPGPMQHVSYPWGHNITCLCWKCH